MTSSIHSSNGKRSLVKNLYLILYITDTIVTLIMELENNTSNITGVDSNNVTEIYSTDDSNNKQ